MKYELHAMERHAMKDRINELETMLKDIQSDFAKCAQGISPCFFCANDDTCQCTNECNNKFIWAKHN